MIVDCAIYEEWRRDGTVELERLLGYAAGQRRFVWIGLHEPSAEEFDSLKREFDLHPLAVEDAIKAHQRPKLEVYGDMVFLVLKTARYVDPEEVIELGELLVFLGHDFVITVRHGEGSALKQVREDLEHDQARLSCGPGIRAARDPRPRGGRLRPIHRRPQADIDEVEAELFSGRALEPRRARVPAPAREVLEFRRATAPLVDPLDRLAAGHYAQVHPEICNYFQDVNDHLIRTVTSSTQCATCCSRASRPTSPRWRCVRTTTYARSRPGSPSRQCRRWWRASTG